MSFRLGAACRASSGGSPEGKRIAYVLNGKLTVADVDGAVVTEIAAVPGNDPSWAPDGTKLVFMSGNGSIEGLYVFDVATQRVTPLIVHRT